MISPVITDHAMFIWKSKPVLSFSKKLSKFKLLQKRSTGKNSVFQSLATYHHWKTFFQNRCILQISSKYKKLIIPKILFILFSKLFYLPKIHFILYYTILIFLKKLCNPQQYNPTTPNCCKTCLLHAHLRFYFSLGKTLKNLINFL